MILCITLWGEITISASPYPQKWLKHIENYRVQIVYEFELVYINFSESRGYRVQLEGISGGDNEDLDTVGDIARQG